MGFWTAILIGFGVFVAGCLIAGAIGAGDGTEDGNKTIAGWMLGLGVLAGIGAYYLPVGTEDPPPPEAYEPPAEVFAREHGVPLDILCRYDRRLFADTRTAWAQDGNPDDLSTSEEAFRAQLLDTMTTDFLAETGTAYGPVADAWTSFVSRYGNPCQ